MTVGLAEHALALVTVRGLARTNIHLLKGLGGLGYFTLSAYLRANKVSRGNSGRGINSGRPLLFSGEEGLHFQTWYAWTTTLA